MVTASAAEASQRPIAVDLYAGAGGLSLGMEQAGFEVAVAAEFDPIHALTHRFNFPNTPVLTKDLGASTAAAIAQEIRELAGGRDLDALVGGPPCQGFSVGGVRAEGDERNSLLLRFVDLVVDLQPRAFCLENVAGLLEPRFEPLRKEVLRRLTVDGGFDVGGFDAPVNAAHYGVPQTRRRVLVFGSRVGNAPRLADPVSPLVTVGDALAGLPSLGRYGRLLRTDEVEMADADLLQMRLVRSSYARRLSGLDADPQDRSWPRAHQDRVLTNSLRTVHTRKTIQRFSRTPPGNVESVSRLFRLELEGQARTLRAGTGSDRGSHTSPRPIHPEKNRVITVREAARLHGYPDWFRFHRTNWHGHRQVGNSVPPPLAAAAGRALLAALEVPAPARPENVLSLGDPEWLGYSRAAAAAVATA